MRTSIIFAGLCALAAVTAAGAVTGTIKTEIGEAQQGNISWSSRDKAYVVTKGSKDGSLEVQVPQGTFYVQVKAADVVELDILKPEAFDAAVAQVNGGNGAAAIPALKNIVKEYSHLIWDKKAGRYLAEAYLAAEKPDEALKTCEAIIAGEPSAAYKGDLAPAYWSALLKLNRRSALEKNMEKALKGKDRFSRGAALLMTGDIIMKDGKESNAACKKALTDGYLRVVYLYTDEDIAERLRPEALYKAALCFSTLRQSGRADVMRTELKASYASSPWAKK